MSWGDWMLIGAAIVVPVLELGALLVCAVLYHKARAARDEAEREGWRWYQRGFEDAMSIHGPRGARQRRGGEARNEFGGAPVRPGRDFRRTNKE